MGETKRTINIRAEEHIAAIKSASKRNHSAEHCWRYIHDLDWEQKKALDFEKSWKTRTIKEAIYSEEKKHYISGIPSNYQTSGNQYYEKANQRKQPPKLRKHQTAFI